MPVFANINVTPAKDGLPYADAALMPALEADLFNRTALSPYDPIPILYEAAIVAAVEFSVQGTFTGNSCYVVLQTDLGDGVWFDLAWCISTLTSGTANFLLSAGVGGANSFQQTRASGTAPSSNSSNQCPLGGRVRFVGKASITGAGSSSSGAGPGVLVTIKYKLTPLR